MRIKIVVMLIAVLALMLMAGSALGISSANYRLDWFTPLTGGGGGAANSTNYAVNFTVGQSAIGSYASANYSVGLGYWYGVAGQLIHIYLPLILQIWP
jgi:hypothetical protein